MKYQFQIRSENAEDYDAIDFVHDQAFGQKGEGKLVRALRDQGYADRELSIVAVIDRKIIGHILFSVLDQENGNDQNLKILALAPVAVLREFQNGGIGSALIREGINVAAKMGYNFAFVLGDPKYYSRFSFDLEMGAKVRSPYNGSHFMGMKIGIQQRSLPDGVYLKYPDPFSMV